MPWNVLFLKKKNLTESQLSLVVYINPSINFYLFFSIQTRTITRTCLECWTTAFLLLMLLACSLGMILDFLGSTFLVSVICLKYSTWFWNIFDSGMFGERLPLRYYLSSGMILSGLFTVLFGLGFYWQIHSLWYYCLVQVS